MTGQLRPLSLIVTCLTAVDSLEASVISRLPLRPSSAGTRMNTSVTFLNTGQCCKDVQAASEPHDSTVKTHIRITDNAICISISTRTTFNIDSMWKVRETSYWRTDYHHLWISPLCFLSSTLTLQYCTASLWHLIPFTCNPGSKVKSSGKWNFCHSPGKEQSSRAAWNPEWFELAVLCHIPEKAHQGPWACTCDETSFSACANCTFAVCCDLRHAAQKPRDWSAMKSRAEPRRPPSLKSLCCSELNQYSLRLMQKKKRRGRR